MTASELEAMIGNLNTRTTAIEQILPTLATKADLTTGLNGVEARLGGVESRLDSLRSQMLSLHENVKAEYRLLAEHLADLPTEIRRLSEQVAVIPELKGDIRQLIEQVAGLARKIDGSPRRRR